MNASQRNQEPEDGNPGTESKTRNVHRLHRDLTEIPVKREAAPPIRQELQAGIRLCGLTATQELIMRHRCPRKQDRSLLEGLQNGEAVLPRLPFASRLAGLERIAELVLPSRKPECRLASPVSSA
jgi:hypothetical protein